MELSEQLGQLGLTEVTFKHNLSKEVLFHESIANDRGRTRLDGPYTDQKSFPTKLGVQGPLLYYTVVWRFFIVRLSSDFALESTGAV